MGKERERDSWVTENEIGRIFENFWYTHRELIFFFSKEGRADSEKLSFLKRSVLTAQVVLTAPVACFKFPFHRLHRHLSFSNLNARGNA